MAVLNLSPLLVLALLARTFAKPTNDAPKNDIVDLGYAQHIPTYHNTTISGHKVKIYKNIRFANAPTGNLRFRAPDTKLPKVHGVQDGKVPWASTACIASAPGYIPYPEINGTTWGREDCLFLDVYVPEGVNPGDDVPVLHNFFGSAYAFGSKDIMFSPMGLFDRMFRDHADKFIFVSNNYRNCRQRLGMPGWTYAEGEDMDGNVGMLDCLAAAEWTSKYIKDFGGDGKRITTIGQSAGAGMIYYLMVAYAGRRKLPFQQAYLSSPAAPPKRNVTERQKELFNLVLKTANCTTLRCLRSVPEETMIGINDQLINQMPSQSGGGQIGPLHGFGPAPDGKIIPDLPLAMLRRGEFYKGLNALILGSMALEGMGTSHDTGLPGYFPIMVRQQLPYASSETIKMLQDEYHDASKVSKMAWDWTTDIVFACNANNLANSLPSLARRYIMSTPPAVHGQDLDYFFNNEDIAPVNNTELVNGFQRRLLNFVNGQKMDWPVWGSVKEMYNITDEFEGTTLPRKLMKRCDLLNQLILDPANGA
ncbi:Carboxylesterase, type B, partial [Metarhizium brunneum ARSEF 3297]